MRAVHTICEIQKADAVNEVVTADMIRERKEKKRKDYAVKRG